MCWGWAHPGSVTLLAGEPGMGKSTLLLQALGRMARHGARCLLVTAESPRPRCGRAPSGSGRSNPACSWSPRRRSCTCSRMSRRWCPTCSRRLDPDGGRPRAARCAGLGLAGPRLRVPPGATGEGTELVTVMVGHVTKEGTLAGRVCSNTSSIRCCRSTATAATRAGCSATKHRFGATDELGLFEMAPAGLLDVRRVGAFLVDRRTGAPGSAVAVVLEEARPLLVEVQPLVIDTKAPLRRSSSGLDAGRLAMLLAVPRAARASPCRVDVCASVAGGLRVGEPGVDLALVLAVAGARLRRHPRAHGRGGRSGARWRSALGAAARAPPRGSSARLDLTRARAAGSHTGRGDRPRRRAGRRRSGRRRAPRCGLRPRRRSGSGLVPWLLEYRDRQFRWRLDPKRTSRPCPPNPARKP